MILRPANIEEIRGFIGNLLPIDDQYPKYVVTMDDFWRESIEGVKHLYITDFLSRPTPAQS